MVKGRFGRAARWATPLAAFVLGLALGHAPEPRLGQAARAAETWSPVQRLIAEDEIRQKLALYPLLADGDGPGGRPRNLREMAEHMMTADVVSEIHTVKGGPPKIFTGREMIANTPPEVDPERARHEAGRHYMVSTYFDDVSPTTAHTRSIAVYFSTTKNLEDGPCGAAGQARCGREPLNTVMWVYEMTWKKTPDGWQIARNVLRDDN